MISIKTDSARGKIVVAQKALDPGSFGLQVLEEEALIIAPRPSAADLAAIPPSSLDPQTWVTYRHFLKQPADKQQEILEFYAELDCPKAIQICEHLEELSKQQDLSSVDADLFVKVAMVFEFNAVECCPQAPDGSGPGASLGSGLFRIACKMSHSCRPNTVWFTSQSGQKKILRVIEPVEEGEELTIDYTGLLMRPTHERRAKLERSKAFVCNCARCTKLEDDARRFKCGNSKCGGFIFASRQSPDELLSCTLCSSATPNAQNLLRDEAELRSEIDEINRICDEGLQIDVTSRIRKLKPPHVLHHLAAECACIQGELFVQHGDWVCAARAYEAQVVAIDAVLGRNYANRQSAFANERLGDAFQHFNLVKAQEAFRRTVQTLQITDGASEPYSKLATKKLLEVQRRLSEASGDLEHCSLCGLPAKAKCSRCGEVVYCCKEHQKAQWPLHKTWCVQAK
jgi:hypothetical protein